MLFSSQRLIPFMVTAVSNRIGLLKRVFLFVYPLVFLSGFLARMYWGAPTISSLQTSTQSFYFPCIFHWLTNWDCPGCGITRSLVSIYLWSPGLSFYFHPLGPVIAVGVFLYWLSLFQATVARYRSKLIVWAYNHAYSVLAVVFMWGILRNI